MSRWGVGGEPVLSFNEGARSLGAEDHGAGPLSTVVCVFRHPCPYRVVGGSGCGLFIPHPRQVADGGDARRGSVCGPVTFPYVRVHHAGGQRAGVVCGGGPGDGVLWAVEDKEEGRLTAFISFQELSGAFQELSRTRTFRVSPIVLEFVQ